MFVCCGSIADARPLVVNGLESACPAPEVFMGALVSLQSDIEFAAQASLQVLLRDDGDKYSVEIAGQRKQFSDARRDCADRARIAAVFVALVLPSLPARVAPVEAPVRPVLLQSAPVSWRALFSTLELAATFSVAPRRSPSNSLYAGGGSLRASLGTRNLSGVIGVGGLSPVAMNLVASGNVVGRTRLTRVPLDVGVRAAYRWHSVEMFGDLSLAIIATFLRGEGLVGAQSATRFEYGLRLALGLRGWLRERWGLFGNLETSVFPVPYAVSVDPLGELERAPVTWVSAQIGVVVRLR